MKNDTASEWIKLEEKWDEYWWLKNPNSIGWALAFIGINLIWMFGIYCWLSINGFSQIGQWNEETKEHTTLSLSKMAKIHQLKFKSYGSICFS